MGKMRKIILNEDQITIIKTNIGANKQFSINPEKVLIVKKFLDNGFKRGNMEQIGAGGLPELIPIIGMLGSNGIVLKNLYMDQMKDLLVDKFKKMFTDTDEREKFLGQVMKDWYDNKIGLYGSLSVNHL